MSRLTCRLSGVTYVVDSDTSLSATSLSATFLERPASWLQPGKPVAGAARPPRSASRRLRPTSDVHPQPRPTRVEAEELVGDLERVPSGA
jgi:hypothetical protein